MARVGNWRRCCAHPVVVSVYVEYGYSAVLVVPTGIGASMGGYAGDALPVRRKRPPCMHAPAGCS